MSDKPKITKREGETPSQAMARLSLTPECLSAVVLLDSKMMGNLDVIDVVDELRRQTAALNSGDMTRAEDMLLAQAHTLDNLFAQLTGRALRSQQLSALEPYMRLALKAQNQARATLQTLGELKAPKQVAFVQQANIGNQVQVNNGTAAQPARTRKTQKAPNELLEVQHGERLDTRATGSAGSADKAMATLEEQHRPSQRRREG
ncbi:hypothetical protein [Pseudomonas fluvialis]|uniref:Uncharacterized protein n=1 Tax=Pseudomonas fluvialis TaxID=1793966 RepID=A0ABQ2AFZ7_9PSED|nr:hypothetical protein [Pseudomonas fluvialis]GGH90173.1 hypothetical protein GCM10007363_07040 [Pseudomonas fluvialis]